MNCQKEYTITIPGGCATLPALQSSSTVANNGPIAISNDGAYMLRWEFGHGAQPINLYALPGFGLLGTNATSVGSVPTGQSCAWNDDQAEFVACGMDLGAPDFKIYTLDPAILAFGAVSSGKTDDTVGNRVVCNGSDAYCAGARYIYRLDCVSNTISNIADFTDGGLYDLAVCDVAFATATSILYAGVIDMSGIDWVMKLYKLNASLGIVTSFSLGIPAPYNRILGPASVIYAPVTGYIYALYNVDDGGSNFATVITVIDTADDSTVATLVAPSRQLGGNASAYYAPDKHQICCVVSDGAFPISNGYLLTVCDDTQTFVGSLLFAASQTFLASGSPYSVDNSVYVIVSTDITPGSEASLLANFKTT